jgi:putative hydrolase of the HAD superfamily
MSVPQRTRVVLLDALGTLLYFDPPAPLLREALRERAGIEVPAAAASAAIKAEIAYYRAHLHEGRDPASLADLRRRSAEAMRPALGIDASADVLTEALLAALRFRAYPDAVPALVALRALGLSIVVVSNWDHSLHARLAETGLAPLVDGAVASAELGHAKPDRAIFEHALELAGADPGSALHAGDAPEEDVGGALAAGLRAVLVARDGRAGAGPDVPVIRSLAELPPLCGYARGGR